MRHATGFRRNRSPSPRGSRLSRTRRRNPWAPHPPDAGRFGSASLSRSSLRRSARRPFSIARSRPPRRRGRRPRPPRRDRPWRRGPDLPRPRRSIRPMLPRCEKRCPPPRTRPLPVRQARSIPRAGCQRGRLGGSIRRSVHQRPASMLRDPVARRRPTEGQPMKRGPDRARPLPRQHCRACPAERHRHERRERGHPRGQEIAGELARHRRRRSVTHRAARTKRWRTGRMHSAASAAHGAFPESRPPATQAALPRLRRPRPSPSRAAGDWRRWGVDDLLPRGRWQHPNNPSPPTDIPA